MLPKYPLLQQTEIDSSKSDEKLSETIKLPQVSTTWSIVPFYHYP